MIAAPPTHQPVRDAQPTLPGIAPPEAGAEVLAEIDGQVAWRSAQHLAELRAHTERRALAAKWLGRALSRLEVRAQ